MKSSWLSFDDPFLPSEKLRAHSGDKGGLALVRSGDLIPLTPSELAAGSGEVTRKGVMRDAKQTGSYS